MGTCPMVTVKGASEHHIIVTVIIEWPHHAVKSSCHTGPWPCSGLRPPPRSENQESEAVLAPSQSRHCQGSRDRTIQDHPQELRPHQQTPGSRSLCLQPLLWPPGRSLYPCGLRCPSWLW